MVAAMTDFHDYMGLKEDPEVVASLNTAKNGKHLKVTCIQRKLFSRAKSLNTTDSG